MAGGGAAALALCVALLPMAAPRDAFRLQPGDLVATAGQALELPCVPPWGHPEPRVTWKKDGVALDLASGRYEVSRGTLRVAQARRSDSGAYVCVATTGAGQRESRPALVSVLEKPWIARPPRDAAVPAGGTVELACGARGEPPPWVQWHKERGDLPWGRHEVDPEHTLRLHAVAPADAGTYVCTAQSQLGAAAAAAVLRVEGGQEAAAVAAAARDLQAVRLHLENGTALPAAAAVRLRWRVLTAAPAPEGFAVLYRCVLPAGGAWARHDAGRALSAVVATLRRGCKYEFKVRPYAGGRQGLDSNSRHLWIPEEAPSAAPQRVAVARDGTGNGTVAVVSWEPPPPDAHNGIIRGYKVWSLGDGSRHGTNRTVDGGTRRLETLPLGPGATYCVQVAAFNGAGLGVPSNVTCGAPEPLPEAVARGEPEALPLVAAVAGAGALLWVTLLGLLVRLCRRRGGGPCGCAGEAAAARQRLEAGDSPWLSGTWRSTCGSKTLGSVSSISSHLLWSDTSESPRSRGPGSPAVGLGTPTVGRGAPAGLGPPPWCRGTSMRRGGDTGPLMVTWDLQRAPGTPACSHGPHRLLLGPQPGATGPLAVPRDPERGPGTRTGCHGSPHGAAAPAGSAWDPRPVPWDPQRPPGSGSCPGLLIEDPQVPSPGKDTGHPRGPVPTLLTPPGGTEAGAVGLARGGSPAPSAGGDSVLTPERAAECLEAAPAAGYGCEPAASEPGEEEEEDEEDEEEEDEDERTVAGSLLNAWGSASEATSASGRCSPASSSDGSFLADADFARALALAAGTLCFGLDEEEEEEEEGGPGLYGARGSPGEAVWGRGGAREERTGPLLAPGLSPLAHGLPFLEGPLWRPKAEEEEEEAAASPVGPFLHPWPGSHGMAPGSPLGGTRGGLRRERSRGPSARRL